MDTLDPIKTQNSSWSDNQMSILSWIYRNTPLVGSIANGFIISKGYL